MIPSFDCVIPAAGSSVRMGVWKPILGWGSASIVETSVGAALGAGCRVLLVSGFRGDELVDRFRAEPRIVVVDNPRWERGMLGSIQSALPLVSGEAFFCANADMPFIVAEDYAALAAMRSDHMREEEAPAAYFAAHQGSLGHPALIPSAWIPEILALDPGERLRPFLLSRPHFSLERGIGAVTDIDTPEDYERSLGRLP